MQVKAKADKKVKEQEEADRRVESKMMNLEVSGQSQSTNYH